MNISDSERIAASLESCGFVPASRIENADLVIFNTCGVRQSAENRAYTLIHNLKRQAANDKKQIKIVLTGCLANRKDVQRRLKDLVDLFFAIDDFDSFKNWITKNYLKIKNSKLKISAQNGSLNKEEIAYLSIKPKYNNKYQAYVPIMTGCNNFCSYCVVPYARGREISRRTEEIISEIKDLAKNGCKHVMLLGQNVNSYKGENGINFSKLLKKINAIPGKFWISFISSHPKDFDDELIETIAKCKKVCEWVHLPVQAGSDEIIRKMNRHYTQKQYLAKIAKIRKAFKRYKPDAIYSLSSDIIVGFPGETRKQFLESAKVMEKVKYDMVFFGQFSPRPGTAAWKMKDSVSRKEKARRENFLNEILAKTALTNNRKYIGKTVEVLVEKHDGRNYFGKTRTMKNVKIITSRKNLVGKIIKAKIEKASAWNLEGRYGNF